MPRGAIWLRAALLVTLCAPGDAAAMYTETVLISNPADLIFAGGSSFSQAPLASIRSGNPGQRTTASLIKPLNPGATLRAVQFAYRYDTGFGAASAPLSAHDSNFSVVGAATTLYASPHLRDYSYGANRSNYSDAIPVTASGLSVVVPTDGQASYLEIVFDNNARNMQLLLPLEFNLTCSGLPCHKSDTQLLTLDFEPPNIVSGPECPTSQGGGPWWDKIHPIDDVHALGWAEDHMIATTDAGKTWNTLVFNDSCTKCGGSTSRFAYDGGPGWHNFGNLHITGGSANNVTAMASNESTRYFLNSEGKITETLNAGVSIMGIPNLRMFSPGSGDCLTLPDRSMVCVQKSVLASGSGKLSCVAIRSLDGGFNWTWASVVASAEEVPYAHEGPSESTLGVLANGTLMAVMRVEGEQGRYSPYISKLSDDKGLSWHSLRSFDSGGSGSITGAGCVRPRLLKVGNSLVLGGGRPNPISRDVVLWLNSAGDGEEWEAFSVSYYHNTLTSMQNKSRTEWLFPEAATNNSRSFPRLTTSYTSMVSTGNRTGYILYGMGIRSFTLPFKLVARKA